MTLDECITIITPLALAMRTPMDEPSFLAYHRVLEDVPARVFQSAVGLASRDGRRFFPSAAELREVCERARVSLRAQLKFQPCVNCTHDGWAEREINGVRRMVRCSCWQAHQARVAELGVGDQPLALPAAQEFSRLGESDAA